MSFSIPTFKPESSSSKNKSVDVTALTASQISSLKTQDPFMYYSIFTPDGEMISEIRNRVQGKEESKEEKSNGVRVQRRTRISVERDLSADEGFMSWAIGNEKATYDDQSEFDLISWFEEWKEHSWAVLITPLIPRISMLH